jgi:hypothetical protein
MKKILLSLLLVSTVAWSKLSAQCTIAQTSVKISDISINPSTCEATFTLEFDIANNGGNKFSYIHIWNADAAPSPAIVWSTKPNPTLTLLQDGAGSSIATLLRTISLDYHTDPAVITPLSDFPASNTVNPTVQSTGITATNVNGHFKITGIKVPSASCSATLTLKADVWSAQDNNGKNVACGTSGLSFVANDPVLKGELICGTPRSFKLQVHTTVNRTITYTAYLDANNNHIIDPADTIPANILKNPSNVPYANIVINNPGSADPDAFTSYGGNNYQVSAVQSLYDVIIVAQGTDVINRSLAILKFDPLIECGALSVKFKSFNASRTTASNVAITWTTASEQNSKGFNVQKNVGGEWKTIAFVPSQALGGNSSYDINYSFKDANSEKGITQYRVQQVDLDGKFAYTDIRAIRGEGAVGKIVVYPNPSVDGKVNVVFEDNTVRDIQVNDMQGKIIRSYRGVTNNILVIERLTSGFYTIKITNRNTAASSVEKVVVK